MKTKTIRMIILVITTITICLIFTHSKENSNLAVPKPEELSSITFTNVVDGKGVKKTTASEQLDINKLLGIFKNSERTNKDSTSDFPNKTEFIAVSFNFKTGGNSWRSIYKENGDVYVHQPYDSMFKLKSNKFNKLDEIMKLIKQ